MVYCFARCNEVNFDSNGFRKLFKIRGGVLAVRLTSCRILKYSACPNMYGCAYILITKRLQQPLALNLVPDLPPAVDDTEDALLKLFISKQTDDYAA